MKRPRYVRSACEGRRARSNLQQRCAFPELQRSENQDIHATGRLGGDCCCHSLVWWEGQLRSTKLRRGVEWAIAQAASDCTQMNRGEGKWAIADGIGEAGRWVFIR